MDGSGSFCMYLLLICRLFSVLLSLILKGCDANEDVPEATDDEEYFFSSQLQHEPDYLKPQ